MASNKTASITVSIKNQGFKSGLKEMEGDAKKSGETIGTSLSEPMKKGIEGANGAIKSMFSEIGSAVKTVATLGGAVAIGSFVKQAVDAQTVYRDLANQINRVKGNSEDWKSVMASIQPVAERTGQTSTDMAAAFKTVFSKTGDLEFSKKSLEGIGTAATATGIKAEQLAAMMQIAYRKFGVEGKDANAALAAFVEKIGHGGVSAELLGDQFASIAGDASAAGMKGTAGISQLLGMVQALDKRVGEKAIPGLQMMFMILKEGGAAAKNLQLTGNVKFKPDMTMYDKVRETLKSDTGRNAAKVIFTADSRTVYDSLSQPFEQAYQLAKKQGKSTQDATKAGLAAYDASVAAMGTSTAKYSDLQAQAADRMKNDPAVIWRMALDKMAVAFQDPKMMGAIEKLAQMLPRVADGFVKLMSWVLNNPELTAGLAVGAKVGGGFAGGALNAAGDAAGKNLMAIVGPMLMSNATSAGTAMGMAVKGALVTSAALVGFAIGKMIADAFWDAKAAREKGMQEASTGSLNALHSGDIEKKKAGLSDLQARIAQAKADRNSWTGQASLEAEKMAYVGSKAVGNKDAFVDTGALNIQAMEASAKELAASIQAQQASNKGMTASTDKVAASMVALSQAADKAMASFSSVKAPPSALSIAAGHDLP